MCRRSIFIISCFYIQIFYAQLSFQGYPAMALSNQQIQLKVDSAETSFDMIKIPFSSFDIQTSSNPGFNSFVSQSNHEFILNLDHYKNNVNTYSHHLLDFYNSFFEYKRKRKSVVHSYGLEHRLFAELLLSNEFVSLIVEGNYPHLNEEINLNNNYMRVFNYVSFFYGFSKTLNENWLFGSKLNLIKGVGSIGLENRHMSLLFSDNFNTNQNPFSTVLDGDIQYYQNSSYSFFSNLGFSIDFNIAHKLNSHYSIYTNVSELGCIFWREDQYSSSGYFDFDGIDYSLDQDLITEFNYLYDTIVDVFDIIQNNDTRSVRILPFSIDVGIQGTYTNINQVGINYNLQKLYNSVLHTGSVSYIHVLENMNLSIMPIYSFNKFNYMNFSVFVNKKWGNKIYSNFYLQNMLGLFDTKALDITKSFGFGSELLLFF